MQIRFIVNGDPHEVDVPGMRRLLDVLREDLGLTGTKEGCGEGECGACSVILDSQVVDACLVPICQVDGHVVRTVEGLAPRREAGGSADADGPADAGGAGGAVDAVGAAGMTDVAGTIEAPGRAIDAPGRAITLDPLQQAFWEAGGAQCGICTPGMLMAARAYLDAGGTADEDAIREAIAGNLCRCTGYTKIVDAIAMAADLRGSDDRGREPDLGLDLAHGG